MNNLILFDSALLIIYIYTIDGIRCNYNYIFIINILTDSLLRVVNLPAHAHIKKLNAILSTLLLERKNGRNTSKII